MIWWATLPARARDERAQLANLQERSDWLAGLSWRIEEPLRLVADFEIHLKDKNILLTLRYPDHFPDVPPSVVSSERERLSGHQYGPDGELCLEHRPDNWVPTITGAMMVESAHRLLAGESDIEAPPVPTAHQVTLGQEVRASGVRFALTEEAASALRSIPVGQSHDAVLTELRYADTWVAALARLGSEEEPALQTKFDMPDHSKLDAIAYRLPDDALIPHSFSGETLPAFFEQHGLGAWFAAAKERRIGYSVFANESEVRLVGFGLGEKLIAFDYRTIPIPNSKPRLPEGFQELQGRRVAIVGCGSLGSKLAVSLARSGVGNFLLIDSDIFFPHNVVRNELDRRAVAINKSKALKQRILEVASAVKIDHRSILLGGQESAEITASAMSQLSKCDLIVDATANPTVFNLCAAVAKAELKPMIWGEVFAGGVGGLVAMSRPNQDPPPQLARNQILDSYRRWGVPWEMGEATGYGLEVADQPPMIASDAEVTIIAGHLARFATDILVQPSFSAFPYPAYVIGFAAAWNFTAPFDTLPIAYSAEGEWGQARDANAGDDLSALLAELFPKASDEG